MHRWPERRCRVAQELDEPNIARALGFLRRRGIWIALCVMIAAVAALAYSKHETKKYTATAPLVFNNNQLSQAIAGVNTGTVNPLLQQENNLELLRLGDMALKTAHT